MSTISFDGSVAASKIGPTEIIVVNRSERYLYNFRDEPFLISKLFEEINAMAISNKGIMIITFGNTRLALRLVYIMDVRNSSANVLYRKVWTNDFGDGISITENMVAISTPSERSVNTFELIGGLSINYNSKALILNVRSDTDAFGRRLALAASGKSMAIVSQHSSKEAADVGKIYIYVREENSWSVTDYVLFGMSDVPFFGLGGVFVDDLIGRVDVKINDMEKASYLVSFRFSLFSL